MTTHTLHPSRSRILPALIILTVIAAAGLAAVLLTGNDTPADSGNPGMIVPQAMGPGISVGEALASTLDQPLLVNGFLYVTQDGTVYLTEMLAESYPPSADLSRSLQVAGLDLETVTGLQTARGISWTDTSLQLVGEVDGTILTISGNVSA